MGVTVLGIQHHFYPRSPCGERPIRKHQVITVIEFLSTLSLRRATLLSLPFRAVWIISIHALLAESDMIREPTTSRNNKFLSTLSLRRATSEINTRGSKKMISIHALLAESDVVDTVKFTGSVLFLSTLSLRRATSMILGQYCESTISIHALLAESDRCTTQTQKAPAGDFYPRSPCGERR